MLQGLQRLYVFEFFSLYFTKAKRRAAGKMRFCGAKI
jgi:hypothetical protein